MPWWNASNIERENNMKAMQPSVSSGLSTDTFKVTTAGLHSIYARSTVIQPSGLVVTLSQSGSTSASVVSSTTSPMQEEVEVNGKFNCAVGDILSVVVTSSAPVDQPPNLIKTIINLRQGL
jgi:hypothetical protein